MIPIPGHVEALAYPGGREAARKAMQAEGWLDDSDVPLD